MEGEHGRNWCCLARAVPAWPPRRASTLGAYYFSRSASRPLPPLYQVLLSCLRSVTVLWRSQARRTVTPGGCGEWQAGQAAARHAIKCN